MRTQQALEIRYGILLGMIYRERVALGYPTSNVRYRAAIATGLARRAYERTVHR